MTGTDALESGEPMTEEMAEALSQQILSEDYGIKTGEQAEGADHTGEIADGANQNPDGTEGAEASANPESQTEDGANEQETPAPEVNAAWASTLPEEVRADLSRFRPETVTQLRKIAESGLREADYTQKTQALARDRSEVDALQHKVRFADSVLNDPAKMAALYGAEAQAVSAGQSADQPTASTDSKIRELMKTDDPDAFAKGLDEVIEERIAKARMSSPEAKATVLNEAAEKIREVLAPKIPEGTWERAVELFNEHCQQSGSTWYETKPRDLAMALRPHIRFALAEYAASQSKGTAPTQDQTATSTPAPRPGVRAAAVPSSGSMAPTKSVPPHVREGREVTEDEAFDAVRKKFGIASEADLARLRTLG